MKTIKYIKGDLVRDAEKDFDVIGHGCNCWCTMGAGIALGVKRKWRRAYDADTATASTMIRKSNNQNPTVPLRSYRPKMDEIINKTSI